MKKQNLLLFILALIYVVPALAAEPLYEGFRSPPASARPFVRWWWNGDAVTETEILRELDILKRAGIGGVEINPVSMPGGEEQLKQAGAKPLIWLGPEWNKMVKAACDGAKQRGMLADLIVGSGWPFGGKFLKPDEQIQIITLAKKQLTGPAPFAAELSELTKLPDDTRPVKPGSAGRLMFLRLVPAGLEAFKSGIEFRDKINPDGSVRFDVPEGEHTLYIGVLHTGFRDVSNGAPGADGPVLDHLNKAAVEKYLDNMSSKLGPALGGKLGPAINAMFCDSIELSGANWTTDFARQFEKRRGYKLRRFLPFILDEDTARDDSRFYDSIRRARYDFYKTFAELFHERFARTFHNWCHENGTLSRSQANGNPWHIDMLNGFMLPDIPEGDGWIVSGEGPFEPNRATEIHYRIWNKTASSAAHLTGKPIVSCEAMTNTIGVFWVTLEYLKESDDLNFISGVNHSVLHGFNYSPPQAGFPGWVKFGTYFSEHNCWWPYFRLFADRNARLSYLFQNAEHQAQIAILAGTADLWSDYGLSKFRYVDYLWYLYPLWHALNHNGYTTDYLSERAIQQAGFKDGKLCCGPQRYDVLLVPDVKSIELKTAQMIRNFARKSGRVVFIGAVPDRAGGFKDLFKNSVSVQMTVRQIFRAGQKKRVGIVSAPRRNADLSQWAGEFMKGIGVKPTVEISKPNAQLLFTHYRAGARDIFFFTNTNRTDPIGFTAKFDTADKTPWLWNPETGARSVYPYADKKNELVLNLGPLESALLVFEPNMPAPPSKPKPAIDFDSFVEIDTPFTAQFTHYVTGEKFSRTFDKLINFADANNDTQLFTFAGTVTYRTEFDLTDTTHTILDLGKVYCLSEVTLNEKPLGLRWYGRHTYDTAGTLKPGKNVLEIKVTTVLDNYVRSLKDNPSAMRYAHWYPPRPAGLVGPVRLLKTK